MSHEVIEVFQDNTAIEITSPGPPGPPGPPGAPGSTGFPPLYFVGFRHVSGVSVSVIQGGFCRDTTDSFDIVLSGSTPVDLATSGVGGLDTGVEAADTWYILHIIADSTSVLPVAGLLSLSSSAPTLPAGYDVFRVVGTIRNKADSNIRAYTMAQSIGPSRTVYWLEDFPFLQVLTSGVATTFTTVPLDAFTCPFCRAVNLRFDMIAFSSGQFSIVRPGGLLLSAPIWTFSTDGTSNPAQNFVTIPIFAPRSIEYLVSNAVQATLDVFVEGYELDLF